MRQGALLRNLAHEHRDRATDRLVDIDNENLVVIPEKNSAPPTGGQDRPHLHLNHRFIHPSETVGEPIRNTSIRTARRARNFFRRALACW